MNSLKKQYVNIYNYIDLNNIYIYIYLSLSLNNTNINNTNSLLTHLVGTSWCLCLTNIE